MNLRIQLNDAEQHALITAMNFVNGACGAEIDRLLKGVRGKIEAAETFQTLRDALPYEAAEHEHLRPLLDCEVLAKHDGFSAATPWPGPQKNVAVWWTLADGRRVGWNENPATGWTFPVLGKGRK